MEVQLQNIFHLAEELIKVTQFYLEIFRTFLFRDIIYSYKIET